MRNIPMAAAFAAALALSLPGCGGGGGGGSSSQGPGPQPPGPAGHYRTDGLPAPLAADVRHMPIYRDDSRILVGVDQTASALRSLPTVAERGNFDIRYGRLNDGNGRAAVAAYLEDADGRHEPPLQRYVQGPEVRVFGSASARDTSRLLAAVRLVNAALPEWARMTVGTPLPGETGTDDFDDRGRLAFPAGTPGNTIFVEFLPCAEFFRGCGRYSGYAWRRWSTPPNALLHSYIQFNTDSSAAGDERRATIVLAHEIIHALGREGHADPRFHTIMEGNHGATSAQGIPQPLSLLYPIDREALRALYSALEPGDGPMDLGSWSSSALYVAGETGHAAFGVVLRNGYAEPWAHGRLPAMELADNAGLTGSAVWRGALLGLTPDAAVVEGDARIGVDLAIMTGQADFTGLETWGPDVPPGARGTGETWLDGDLGYAIAVRGNTFRETGASADAGRLTGVFTGPAHEGAAGTLERSDLTAAFGASR